MCGRYHSTLPREAMRTIFKVDGLIPDLPARYNIAPTQPTPIVRRANDGSREIAIVRWGLVPHWSPGPKQQKGEMINARAETVATKPAFRRAFERHRRIVPASGIYEWLPTGGRRDNRGSYCREYQISGTIDGRRQRLYGTACLQPNGSWDFIN
jgi:putative SOS response-associated peptidase YedK